MKSWKKHTTVAVWKRTRRTLRRIKKQRSDHNTADTLAAVVGFWQQHHGNGRALPATDTPAPEAAAEGG